MPRPSFLSTKPALCSYVLALGLVGIYPVCAVQNAPTAASLLRAELPTNAPLEKVPCGTLAQAVHRAVLTHRRQATSILTTALTGGRTNEPAKVSRPCECVRQLFRAAVSAAPGQAAALLEQAVSLSPDCADALQREAQETSDKNVVNDFKDAPGDPAHRPAGANDFDPSFRDGVVPVTDPGNGPTGFDTPGDLYGGFGVGFGPGFPGSPGFTGSTPSGAIALPPVAVAVTNVVNN